MESKFQELLAEMDAFHASERKEREALRRQGVARFSTRCDMHHDIEGLHEAVLQFRRKEVAMAGGCKVIALKRKNRTTEN